MAIALSAERAVRGPLRPLRRPLRARDAGRRPGRARRAVRRRPRRSRRSGPSYDGLLAEFVGPARRRCPRPRGSAPRPARTVVLKREDLNHTGAHKINNTLGQALLALPHGQAADHRRDRRGPARRGHRHRLRALRARVRGLHGRRGRRAAGAQRLPHASCSAPRWCPVESGTRTLKDATNEALRDWVTNVPDHALHHRLGGRARSVSRAWCATSSRSSAARRGRRCWRATAGCPHTVVACVGGGSNAMGIFTGFIDDAEVGLVGVEAAGEGIASGHHSATLSAGLARACCTAA